jgi:hypothetical protein
MSDGKCTNCGIDKTKQSKSAWWWLNNYYGISGFFCLKCYRKVQHDGYGKPYFPVSYRRILKRQREVASETIKAG